MTARRLLTVAGIVLVSLPANAQVTQYRPPGSLAEATTALSERITEESEDARWTVGKLRVDPRLWISNTGYRDNVFGASEDEQKVSDITGTVGAGLISYIHLGPKIIVSPYLLPEYTWWQDLQELSALNGRWGVEAVGLFNRLTVETEAHSRQRESQLNSEFELPVTGKSKGASAAFQLRLGSRLGAFGSIARDEIRNKLEDPDSAPGEVSVSSLDRDESLFTGGMSYALTDELELSIGLQRGETDFEDNTAIRDNRGTSPMLGLDLDRDRSQIQLTLVDREMEFSSNSPLGSYSAVVGQLRGVWLLNERTDLAVYAGRDVVYSATDTGQVYLESRYGIALDNSFGTRLRMRLYAETGENDYDTVESGATGRADDFQAWGLGLGVEIFRGFSLRAGISRSRIDSPMLDVSRTVTSFGVGFDVSGDRLFRQPKA